MVEINFWKMHGLGNDYIVIDNLSNILKTDQVSGLAKKLCERRFSVGADGLLLVSNSNIADVRMNIFNVDGSQAEMCGNGIRCFIKYCYENGIIKKKEVTVETLSGIKKAWLNVSGKKVKDIRVDMGKPLFNRNEIPMLGKDVCIDEEITINGKKFKMTCLSMGNPHCVIFVDNVEAFDVKNVGSKLENHSFFPNRINVEFVQILSENEIKVRVWERGCGETFACGTGACASVVAGNTLNKIGNKVTVHLIGGDLKIEYTEKVFMTGSAEKVFIAQLF